MTNTLIPYSFIPGTKAKASEVNANFITLADEIQDVHSGLSEDIEDLMENVSNGFETISEKCISDLLLDKRALSYTIISAPNGVMSYSDGILTIPSGLELLIPNGKNSDGTLRNIEYTLTESLTVDMTSYSDGTRYIWLEDEGGYFFADISQYYAKNTVPNLSDLTNVVWYNSKTNELKKYSPQNSAWVSKKAVLLGKVTTSGGYITSISPKEPVCVLTRSDIMELVGAVLPSSGKSLSVLSTGGQYTMPENGYLFVSGTFSNTGYVQLYNTSLGIPLSCSGHSNFPAGVIIPVNKGNNVFIYYYNLTNITVKFLYMEGNK